LFGLKHSLFQESFLRSLILAKLDDIFVVTNQQLQHIVVGEIEELGFEAKTNNIIVEPEAKNTLPAILAGVIVATKDKNETIVVFPSDHMIKKSREFVEIVQSSIELSKQSIITFGIHPTSPHTGYGYIQPSFKLLNGFKVESFKEKPNKDAAQVYLEKGYLWNAGIFMFNSKLFLDEVKKYQADIYQLFTTLPIKEAFLKLEKGISIDYGILEHSNNVSTVTVDIGWNDLGSFDSFFEISETDEHGNIQNENAISIESSNNMLYSYGDKLVATIGVENLIVVDTKDALLICKKDESQKVKNVIEELHKRNEPRTKFHVQDYRHWGKYTILEEEKNEFKIKRILVQPGKKLSYQYHHHRSEHWIVVRGLATITIDDKVQDVPSGESIFIKALQKHRLANNTSDIVEIIEVQLGSYLEEDDIIRLEDEYNRL
jgi:mannose-1-phosphate guanylyltransferase / mannose-6-phosphate isomerase